MFVDLSTLFLTPRGVKIRRTTMAKSCLYCGLQLPDTTDFCPQCGRPIERDFAIRSIQQSELNNLRKEMKGKDALTQQQGFYSDRTRTGKLENKKVPDGEYSSLTGNLRRTANEREVNMSKLIANPLDVVGADFPATGTAVEQMQFLLNYAVLAPSRHNVQPWLF